MLNIIELTALVKTALEQQGCGLEHVELWYTKTDTLYFHVKYHVGNGTQNYCQYITKEERQGLKMGTDVTLVQALSAHLVRGATHG